MASSTQVLGVAELHRDFLKLSNKMQTRISRRMVVAGGRVLVGQAKAVISASGRIKTGSMRKNVAIKREPSAPPGTTQYHLGVRHGRNLVGKQKKSAKLALKGSKIVKVYKDDPYYWRFQHFGTKHVKGVRFLEESLAKGKDEAINSMVTVYNEELSKGASA